MSSVDLYIGRIFIRCDAGEKIGFGHLSRCLIIAKAFRKKYYKVEFIVTGPQENYKLIKLAGFCYHLVNATKEYEEIQIISNLIRGKTDIVLLDSYKISRYWEQAISHFCKTLVVFDDDPTREHCADILIDYTLNRESIEYEQCVSSNCRVLVGIRYAPFILTNQYSQQRIANKRLQFNNINGILLSLGGGDINGNTLNIAEFLLNQYPKTKLVLPIFSTAKSIESLMRLSKENDNLKLIINSEGLEKEMFEADIAIGGCGVSAYERCMMGLPSILMSQADNQRTNIQTLVSAKVAIEHNGELYQLIEEIDYLSDRVVYQSFSDKAMALFDGEGLDRVINAIYETAQYEVA